ncbi:hypothetical protein BCV70DRAFT_9666 [Testicularia cyperi]|uniref:Uncharacterized protein n=1 Tax=Testicularia cyperi TaxID=1882483 RepID=A0A317XXG2_9BASI|nr:hypothetical protein BCV70DRAFT_9666 [Testicularia cyperi]
MTFFELCALYRRALRCRHRADVQSDWMSQGHGNRSPFNDWFREGMRRDEMIAFLEENRRTEAGHPISLRRAVTEQHAARCRWFDNIEAADAAAWACRV